MLINSRDVKSSDIYVVRSGTEIVSTFMDSTYIARNLESETNLDVKLIPVQKASKVKDSILLFMSRHHYFSVWQELSSSNDIFTTWWHGWKGTKVNRNKSIFKYIASQIPYFPIRTKVAREWITSEQTKGNHLDVLKEGFEKAQKVITSCLLTRDRLIEHHGIPPEKLITIPLGVDLNIFEPPEDKGEVKYIRNKFDLPLESTILGNFNRDTQKDGSPKWVKAPDIFLKVVKLLKDWGVDVFVLLTNQRRGFVKEHLSRNNIPFKHIKLSSYDKMAEMYKAIDISTICSREEGGPKQLLESMASSVPVVSTKQGMAIDLIQNGKTGFLCEVDDIQCLASKTKKILESEELISKIENNANRLIQDYSWSKIAKQYKNLLIG